MVWEISMQKSKTTITDHTIQRVCDLRLLTLMTDFGRAGANHCVTKLEIVDACVHDVFSASQHDICSNIFGRLAFQV